VLSGSLLRLLVVLCAFGVFASTSFAASSKGQIWALPQIKEVTSAGLFQSSPANFSGNLPLSRGSLASALAILDQKQHPDPVIDPIPPCDVTDPPLPTPPLTPVSPTPLPLTTPPPTPIPPVSPPVLTPPTDCPPPAPVKKVVRKAPFITSVPSQGLSVGEFDRVIVSYLGLSGAATKIRVELAREGLNPLPTAGTEAVARMLDLRINHPTQDDTIELQLGDPITRSEAAFSLAQVMHFSDWQTSSINEAADRFSLPTLTPWQQKVLRTAVHFIGTPYIWGGNSERGPQSLFGQVVPGGFDCSGFVRRVYVNQSYVGEGRLASTLRGRTTYQMAGEATRGEKIMNPSNLEPGDVLLFGHGRNSKPSAIDHTGIYLGSGWMIHSSGNGVTIVPFEGWYSSSLAFARRPLREAGLDR
jgi:cell wall-associated NlpC family hydrolase